METEEIKEENVIALVKLGINVEDIANVYVTITKKGKDISKQEFIDNLTNMLKFFQTRNKGINDESGIAIYKEDVLEMIKKNRKLVQLSIEKQIKPICEMLDAYYFMEPSDTNKIIKNNPNIFNTGKMQLELFAGMFSCFAIIIDNQTVNLFEYIMKEHSELLEQELQNVYKKLCFLKETKNSHLITKEELNDIKNVEFNYPGEEKYIMPQYNGKDVTQYKDEVLKILK